MAEQIIVVPENVALLKLRIENRRFIDISDFMAIESKGRTFVHNLAKDNPDLIRPKPDTEKGQQIDYPKYLRRFYS